MLIELAHLHFGQRKFFKQGAGPLLERHEVKHVSALNHCNFHVTLKVTKAGIHKIKYYY